MHTQKGPLVINAGCDIFFSSVAFCTQFEKLKKLTNCSKGCNEVGKIIFLYCKKKMSYDIAVKLISQVGCYFILFFIFPEHSPQVKYPSFLCLY